MAKESSGQAASKNQLIMVAVALAALLGVVYFMFLRGGEEPASSTTPAPAAEATPSEEEPADKNDKDEAKAPKKKGKGPVETSEVFGGKDPFEAVLDLNPDKGGGGGAADDGLTDDGTVAPTDDGTTPTTPTTPVTPTPPPDDDDDDEVKTGYRVKLVKIFSDGGTRTAQVDTVKRESWDKKKHTLTEGQRFRKHFKITSIDKRCASFLLEGEGLAVWEGQHVVGR